MLLLTLEICSCPAYVQQSRHGGVAQEGHSGTGSDWDCATTPASGPPGRGFCSLDHGFGTVAGPLYHSATLPREAIHPHLPDSLQLAVELPLQTLKKNHYDSVKKFDKSCIFS